MIEQSPAYINTEANNIKINISSTPVLSLEPPAAIISEVPDNIEIPVDSNINSNHEVIDVPTYAKITKQEETKEAKATVSCLDSYPVESFTDEPKPFKFRELEQPERIIRLKWIRKVFSISTVQLLITFLWSLLNLSENIRDGFHSYIAHIVLLCLGAILLPLLLCVKRINTTFPYNYICAGVYAICQGHLFSLFGIYFEVWTSILVTFFFFAFSLGMTIYVWIVNQQYYYTVSYILGFLLYAISAVVSLFILVNEDSISGWIIITSIMIVVISLYFYMSFRIIDNMAGKEGYSIEDTCLASMYLFSSIILFFLILVGIVFICGLLYAIFTLSIYCCICCEASRICADSLKATIIATFGVQSVEK